MTLDLTPTAADRTHAAEMLASGPGVETATILGAVTAELRLAQIAADNGNTDGVAAAVRRAIALGDAHRGWAPDPRLVRRRAIQRNGRAA